MSLKILLAVLGVALMGTGCTNTHHYPLSGEDCGPADPVRDLSVQQCAPTA
ncbi:hypothetical protein [Tropicimonas isoalkanivorans]|uniref:hypothetical protein n=1 Tax=Tropicimonas isoalkanivorans TaxID=441112 RepID=UPI0015A67086|nr:hypothetical protein [Tropicimonas isoalkanivorans]